MCKNIIDWNFQQKSVLKAENLRHELVDKSLVESGSQKSQEYKLKDYIHFAVDIYEKVNGQWVPYIANDIQFEFIMLNPYWRIQIPHTKGATYETDFRAPDWNGVYKFLINYNRYGYTRLYVEDTAPVRVFRHDEFPRYLPYSYPHFVAVFSCLIAVIIFTMNFINVSEKGGKTGSKVKQE